jgi:hypothetical protein
MQEYSFLCFLSQNFSRFFSFSNLLFYTKTNRKIDSNGRIVCYGYKRSEYYIKNCLKKEKKERKANNNYRKKERSNRAKKRNYD